MSWINRDEDVDGQGKDTIHLTGMHILLIVRDRNPYRNLFFYINLKLKANSLAAIAN